nr:flagellar export protein FliJ [Marinifaba aquimaris]
MQLVAEMEQRKEDKLAADYGQAQQDLAEQSERLDILQTHKKDYIDNVLAEGKQGVVSQQMMRFQSFISQLDKACSQQQNKVHTANKVVEQRRALWLNQQRKRKAIEALLDKQKQQAIAFEQKQEQKMFDEFAIQQFVRRKLA